MNNAFQNLQEQYIGQLAHETVEGAKRHFSNIFADKPAETPPPRTMPTPPVEQESPVQFAPPHPLNPTAQQAQYPPPGQYYPNYQPYPYPPQQQQYGFQPYMPPPPAPRYKVDEAKMRAMAKWKATVDLKYIETGSRLARSILGGLSASNAMVDLLERIDKKDPTLKPEEIELAPNIRKAVEKRRDIERAKTTILNDEDMRSIYEELIFQQMWDQNERGELRLESPDDFRRNFIILTAAEIAESGKDIIVDKISGAFGSVKNKLTGRK